MLCDLRNGRLDRLGEDTRRRRSGYCVILGYVWGAKIIVIRGGRKKRVIIKEVRSSCMINVDRVRITV